LLGLGHRRIAVIGGPVAMLCSQARISGYSAALASAGVEVDPALIRHGNFHHIGGYQAARELLDLPDPPTAIFAGSDEQAFGVAEAARVMGRRIPEDLSVVGFDDLAISRWFSPPLTTVRQPLVEMGRTAAEMLLTMIEGREPHGRQVELATELVIRSSTAPPPGVTAGRRDEREETRVGRTEESPVPVARGHRIG
jgi:LacI family transcriptional regulator